MRRHAELLAYFTKLLAKFPDWTWKAVEVIPSESGFCLKWEANANGAVFVGLDIVEMSDGKISRNEVYFDPAVLAKK